MNISYHPLYRTEDFEKAFILLSANCILDSTEWNDEKKVATFVLEEEKDCLRILDEHKRKKLKLDSTDVLVAYRTLKNELYSGR